MMKKTQITRVQIGNVVCALLMLVLLVVQFTPYWQYGESGELTASIGQYVWFPYNYGELDDHLAAQLGEGYNINQMVLPPVLVLLLSACGAALCIAKPKHSLTAVLPVVCGFAGVWGYLATPALKLGMHWGLHLALSVLILAAGGITLWWAMRDKTA